MPIYMYVFRICFCVCMCVCVCVFSCLCVSHFHFVSLRIYYLSFSLFSPYSVRLWGRCVLYDGYKYMYDKIGIQTLTFLSEHLKPGHISLHKPWCTCSKYHSHPKPYQADSSPEMEKFLYLMLCIGSNLYTKPPHPRHLFNNRSHLHQSPGERKAVSLRYMWHLSGLCAKVNQIIPATIPPFSIVSREVKCPTCAAGKPPLFAYQIYDRLTPPLELWMGEKLSWKPHR